MKDLSGLIAKVPVAFDTTTFLELMLLAAAVCMGISVLGRVLLGKRSGLNHAVSAAIGIMCLYILGAVLYSLQLPYSFLMTSLPFIQASEEAVTVFSLSWSVFPALCAQLLRMVILALLVNLLDCWLPGGKNIFTWYLFRLVTVALALVLQYALFWVLDTYLPDVLTAYAPAILVVLLIVSLLLGVLKLVVGLFLATVNPILAGFYTFFFANALGKQLSKAMFTTLLLFAVVWALNALGCTAISITSAALVAFIPGIIVLLALWYVIRRVL